MSESANPDRLMVVYFTQPHEVGETMPSWRQHLTVVPWAIGNVAATILELQQSLGDFQPFEASVSGEARFGPNQSIPVWLVGQPREVLQSLHRAVLGAVQQHAQVQDTAYVGNDYSPHITPKHGQPPLAIGDCWTIDKLSIVQKTGEERLIYGQVELGYET